MDDPAARLVARVRVVLLTLATVAAALAFDEDSHLGLQYSLTFAAVPAAVGLALAADRLLTTISAVAGAAIDVVVYVAALLAFPSATGALGAAFLVSVLVASYTGGRWVGAATGVAGIAALGIADATDRIPPAGDLALLSAIAVAVALAVVGRADARLLRTAGQARWHEQRAALLLQHLAEPVVVTDASGDLVDNNDAARELLGIPTAATTCARALGLRVDGTPIDCRSGCGLLDLPGSRDAGGLEATAWPEGGEPIPVLVSVVPLPGLDADPEYLHSLRDISKLKEADEAKTLFLAATTHELKTPITVIRGFLDTIAQPNVDDELRLTAIGVMRKRAVELSSIVERILLASRIDSGHFEVDLEDVDVEAVARDRVNAMAAATGREIAIETTGVVPNARADEASLATILDHLLDNACKYSEAPAPIHVQLRATVDHVEVVVRDRGRGMTTDQAKHCFDRFWQADASSSRRVGGTGIGLFIVLSLAEAMRGTVSVDSAPAKGTSFTVVLTRADVDLVGGDSDEVAEAAPPEPSIVREFMRQIGVENTPGGTT